MKHLGIQMLFNKISGIFIRRNMLVELRMKRMLKKHAPIFSKHF